MPCLTQEQLAALALGLLANEEFDGPVSAHVAECDACRAASIEMCQLTEELSAAHEELNRTHIASRNRLLNSLSTVERPAQSSRVWNRLPSTFGRLVARHRFAAGGVGLSTAAGLLLLLAIFANSARQLSAMERMLTAIREVTSYSFNETNNTTYLAPDGKPQKIRREIGFTCWRAPDAAHQQWLGDLYADIKSWHRPSAFGEASNSDVERLALDLSETYPCGKPGIVIVYSDKLYFHTPPVPAGDLPVDNSIAKLRAVREGAGEIVRELGTKRIGGCEARGYIATFHDAVPFRDMDPVEVWVDPQTDLPIELSYKYNKELDKYIDEYHVTDIRWNIDFPADQFATTAPAGLTDTTPPTDEKDIAQITAALKLYADLSGGHYPPIRTLDPGAKNDPTIKADPNTIFDGHLIRDEMVKVAGFTGPPQPDWLQDPKYQKIQSITPGLDWLTRILLDRFHAGFLGTDVTSQDKDKVLLWCMASQPERWRVFFGDLHTEILPEAKLKQLVPTAVLP